MMNGAGPDGGPPPMMDPDAPSPMQQQKREAQAKKYRGSIDDRDLIPSTLELVRQADAHLRSAGLSARSLSLGTQ